MTKFATFVLAFALAMSAVAATPVAADELSYVMQGNIDMMNSPIRMLGQNLCDGHRGTGDAMEASWCYGVVTDSTGRPIGGNPNSVAGQRARGFRADDVQRTRYYGNRYSGSGYVGHRPNRLNRFLNTVFGPERGYYGYGYSGYGWDPYPYGTRAYDEETAGKCFEKVAKAAKKQKVSISAAEIAAFCSGQPLPESQSESTAMPAPEPPPTPETAPVPHATAPAMHPIASPAAVYVQGDQLCNNTNETIAVYVDDVRVGNLSAGSVASISRLKSLARNPKGKVAYYPIGQ